MSIVTKLIAWCGLIAAIGLSVFDFITSVEGIQMVMGPGDGGVIATFMPYLFAMLALCFNGVSAWIFRMHMQQGFTTFASTVTFCMWVGFLTFDALSSFTGILATYARTQVTSWESAVAAMNSLGSLQSFFVIVMAALLSFGPFLCTLFSDLLRHVSNPAMA